MHCLITGGSGQLGQELSKLLEEKDVSFSSFSSSELNILDRKKAQEVVNQEKPDVIFHCAAYTSVDKAEEETEKNWEVNVTGTKNMVDICKDLGILFVYISTDYVFDGTSKIPYTEESPTNPINEYGKAKEAGEKIVANTLEQYYIIRTSWVFGQYGKNFVYTMKRLAKEKEKLTVVADEYGRPTWTRTLAEFMCHLINKRPAYGIYHLTNDDSCSWYEFAQEILKDEEILVEPISSEEYPQKAKRPQYSLFDLSKAKSTGYGIISWKEALKKFSDEADGT